MAYSTGASSTYSRGSGAFCGQHHELEWPTGNFITNKGTVKPYFERICALEKIGKGGFGVVYFGHRCIWKHKNEEEGNCCTKQPWAIKVLETTGRSCPATGPATKPGAAEAWIKREFEVHRKLVDNPNVVTPFKTLEPTKNDPTTYVLAMEYCSNGDLHQFLRGRVITETEARDLTEQVALGLKALLDIGYFHRDVKASNIFVTEDKKFKIGDFGLVAKLDESNRLICGTPTAMAPEMDGHQMYGPKVDVWALGILLFTLLVGPYDGVITEDSRRRGRTLSDTWSKLIPKMLCKNPDQRIGLDDILRDLTSQGYHANRTQASSDSGFLTTSHLSGSTNTTTVNRPQQRAALLKTVAESSGTFRHHQQQRPLQPVRPQSAAMTSSAPSLTGIGVATPRHHLGSPMPSACQSRIASSLSPPLSTMRLRPSSKKHQFKGGFGMIRADGVVHMQFAKVKVVVQNGTFTSINVPEILDFSADGQRIDVQRGAGLEAVRKTYSYSELPTKYWGKYNGAVKFVSITKETTTKVILYTDKVICRLMENGPEANCEVSFYADGPRFTYSSTKGIRVTRSSPAVAEQFSTNTLALDPSHELACEWRVFRETHERILRLEKQLEQMEKDDLHANCSSLFPITIGKRPTSLSGSCAYLSKLSS
jgi:serine/threonine protein kinase